MTSVVVRPFVPETDTGIILGTWPKGKYFSDPENLKVNKKSWFAGFYNHVISALKKSTIRIAVLADDPNFIIGYSVISSGRLEWAYVKKIYRKQGIARLLIKKEENHGRNQSRQENQGIQSGNA